MTYTEVAEQAIRVLVVDDQPLIRMVLKLALTSQNAITIVAEASTARGAETAAAALLPDIILMDIDLPDGNGIDATARICGIQNNSRVIMFSSHDGEDYIRRSFAAGAVGYCIKKAMRTKKLVSAILSVHAGEVWLDSPTTKRIFEDHLRTCRTIK
jgi:DNA-binding NarL/FixJ family response regulator